MNQKIKLTTAQINALGKQHGWASIELQHAHQNANSDYGHEDVLPLANGRAIHTPSSSDCDYVRIVQAGCELAYWTSSEWAEDPEIVMGAIMGAAKGKATVGVAA